MTSKKIVFSQQQSNDECSEFLSSKCLEIDPNVIEREIPTDGHEFLLKVMKERAQYASISRCKLDVLSKVKRRKIDITEEAGTPEGGDLSDHHPLDKLKPTIEWQNIQIADFSELHMYVIRMAARKKQLLPSIFQETYNGFMNDGDILWEKVFDSTEPTLSHVVGLAQCFVESGLITILSLLQRVKPGETIDRRTGLWLHALLTVARHPPQSDDSFILRNLCRRCAEIRASLNPDDENAIELGKPLNIFICIIAKYFGQHDLGDYELYDSKVGQIYFDTRVKQLIYE